MEPCCESEKTTRNRSQPVIFVLHDLLILVDECTVELQKSKSDGRRCCQMTSILPHCQYDALRRGDAVKAPETPRRHLYPLHMAAVRSNNHKRHQPWT